MPRHKATAENLAAPYTGEHDIVAEARQRVYESWTASRKFRAQRDDDRQFQEDQYSPGERQSRAEDEMPTLQIHTVSQRIQQGMEDFRQADVGFRVGAAAGGAGDEVASIFNGLAQADMRHVRSQAALAVATQECLTYGAAWLQLLAIPVSPTNPFDQRLVLRAARNDHVYEDPYDMTRERSEIDWLIEIERMTIGRRNARWPNAAKIEPTNFEAQSTHQDWWFPGGTVGPAQDRECLVAFYYRRIWREVEMVLAEGWPVPRRADELTEPERLQLATGGIQTLTMKAPMPHVEFAVLDGAVPIVPATELPYTRIPYARLVGQGEQTEDEEDLPRGITYYLKDTARWQSITASTLLHKQAFASADFWVVADQADTGQFDDARKPGKRTYPAFAPHPGADGNPIPLPPPFFHTSTPDITAGLQVSELIRDLQGVASGAADAPTREETGRLSSVQVLDRLDRQSAIGRRPYIWWLQGVTMQAIGEIWLDMAGHVYSRRGRILRVAGENVTDEDQGAIVGIPFYRDAKGVPIPVPDLPEGQDRVPNPAAPDTPEMAFKVIRFMPDRDRVKITTYSGITETSGTDAALEVLSNAIAANPALGPPMAVPLVKALAQRYPSMQTAVDRVEAAFPSPTPPDMSAEDAPKLVAQLQQQLEQLTQERDALAEEANQTRAAKEIEVIRAAAKESTTQIQAAAAQDRQQLIESVKQALQVAQHAHERRMQDDEQAHEGVMKGAELAAAAAAQEGKDDDRQSDSGSAD